MRAHGRRTACLLALLVALTASAIAAPAVQTSNVGGVTVTVLPRSLGAAARYWEFEVTLETHVRPLAEDIAAAARLIDARGQPHAPLGWNGDPPGGHHRRGVLRFKPLADNPATVVLEIREVGAVAVRTFRWRRE